MNIFKYFRRQESKVDDGRRQFLRGAIITAPALAIAPLMTNNIAVTPVPAPAKELAPADGLSMADKMAAEAQQREELERCRKESAATIWYRSANGDDQLEWKPLACGQEITGPEFIREAIQVEPPSFSREMIEVEDFSSNAGYAKYEPSPVTIYDDNHNYLKHQIATHDDGLGTQQMISETVTQLSLHGHTIRYTNEDGMEQIIDLTPAIEQILKDKGLT